MLARKKYLKEMTERVVKGFDSSRLLGRPVADGMHFAVWRLSRSGAEDGEQLAASEAERIE
jgi:hypothetical protein